MLRTVDNEIYSLIRKEEKRECDTINLIASENYASRAVLAAVGSVLTDKYAEGYPARRYYGGCGLVDDVEFIACRRAEKLFGVEHANVQPHSGSQANMAVYLAVLQPGDTILGMDLSAGGHLTHGARVNFSGKFFRAFYYGVNRETEMLDFAHIAELAHRYKPKLIICGASAYPRRIPFEKFAEIAADVHAFVCADIAHIAGLVAAGFHPSPVKHAHFITGTTHKTLRGTRGGFILTRRQYADDIDRAVVPGIQGGPLLHVIAGKAVTFNEALKPSFKRYQQQVIKNALVLSSELQSRGYRLVTGGTDNHLVLVDLRSRGITGLEAQDVLEKVGIITNRNAIPHDPLPPAMARESRLGTPAVTTRGMKEKEIVKILDFIEEAIASRNSQGQLAAIRRRVREFARQFPIRPGGTCEA